MLRASRTLASLIGSLLLGTVPFAVVGATALSLTGCKDESQPEYWVDKLSEPAWRARAVARFEQFFEDSLTRANKDPKAKEVQDLIAKTIEPLTKTYVEAADQLDPKSRVTLIKLLAGYRDKRAEPAYKKALEDFAKSPRTGKDDTDVKWAAIAVGDMKLESSAQAMLDAFLKFRANTMLGGVTFKDFNTAILNMPNKAWVGPLITKIEAEAARPEGKKDRDAVSDYMDQQFWQTTSASLLGRIGDPAAVPALIRMVLDPAKSDFRATAMSALIQIGKPSTDAAVKLLKGEDDKLLSYCKGRLKDLNLEKDDPKGKRCVQDAADILGSVGRIEAVGPILEVLKSETDDPTKALLAAQLPNLPATPDSIAGFKTAYESLSADAHLRTGQSALEVLTEASGRFFDAGIADWLLGRVNAIKGDADARKAVQQTITVTSIKLAKADQLPQVKKATDSYGTTLEKQLLTQAEELLKACGDRAPCYVEAMGKTENQDRKNQFVAIKAGYMAGIFGNEQTRDEIVNRIENFSNASVRFVAASVIDRLSPKGAKGAVDKLNDIIDKNAKSPDRDKAMGDQPLKEAARRLAARSG